MCGCPPIEGAHAPIQNSGEGTCELRDEKLFAVVGRTRLWSAIRICILFLACLMWPAAGVAEIREWNYRWPTTGQTSQFKAEYSGMQGLSVLLKAENGEMLGPELPDLSTADQVYVVRLSKADRTEFRTWKGPRGQIVGRYVGIQGRMVVLQSKAGEPVMLGWDSLSPEDQASVVEQQKVVEAGRGRQVQSSSRSGTCRPCANPNRPAASPCQAWQRQRPAPTTPIPPPNHPLPVSGKHPKLPSKAS